MKLAKLSLAAIVVAGLATSSFAADTLADAFKNGKVSGTLETQFIDNDKGGATLDTSGFAVGGELKFKTDSFKGISAGFTFETGHTLGTEKDIALENDTTVAIQETMLSEVYLTYTMGKTTAKVGRQYIMTPLVSVSGSRVMMDYFTGGLVTNTDIEKTTLIAGVVTDYTTRSNSASHLDKPIYTIYGKNASVKDLTLTAQATFHANDRDEYFVDAAYKISGIKVGAQYLANAMDNNTNDGKIYGLMAGTSFGALSLNAYFNDTNEGVSKTVIGGYGHGYDPVYNDMWGTSAVESADTKSYSLKASYKVSSELALMAWYGDFNADNDAKDRSDLDFDIKYSPAAIKGLSVNVKYTILDYDKSDTSDNNQLYTFVKYTF